MPKSPTVNRYSAIIERIFLQKYSKGARELPFTREELTTSARILRIDLPKNLGDVIYSFRYRTGFPSAIVKTQPSGKEWIIAGTGKAQYVFKLVAANRIVPNLNFVAIKIPDATPELVASHALSDEQALLAKIRYNRLIDIFLGIGAYSLQNHLRTTAKGIGQLEIDELYVGVDRYGRQFILPVQAKGGSDKLGSVQINQDIICCAEKFPRLICRSIAAQFINKNLIALFELIAEGDEIKIVDEKHYHLVPASEIGPDELARYAQTAR